MRRSAALLLALCAGSAAPAAAQQCGPSYREVAAAVYAQVAELGGGAGGLDYWAGQLQAGATVKQMVDAHLRWDGYRDRFITGHDSRTVLTYLYRHILAREPDDGAWGWVGVGEANGWGVVMDGLINSAEYATRFGDHTVPGSPVVAWDCARANLVTAAHHDGYRDATQGGANVTFTTPAYVSLDQPRALTFLYSSGVADPRSFVEFDVLHNTGDPPDRISLEVRNGDGARMTLTDGSQEVYFRAGAGATRVSAEFREPQHPNRAVGYTAVVRKHWPDGRVQEHTLSTRAAHLTSRESEFGHGWELVGFQRLYNQGDGVHITETGKGAWFWLQGTDGDGSRRYASPAGDFSTVRWHAPDGTYHRVYPNGTRVRFGWDGRMLDVADRSGSVTQYGYDGAGRLAAVIDPAGKQISLGYSGAGALAWVQDPAGRRVTATSTGRTLYQFWQPDGSWALDMHFVDGGARGHVLDSYWIPGGERNAGLHTAWSFGYDAHGRVASFVAPQVSTTDAGVTRPLAPARSRQMAVLAQPGAGGAWNPSPRVVPAEVRVEAGDALGNTVRMAVDPFGAPTRIEEPMGRVTRLTRDRHSRPVQSVTPTGRTTLNEYVGVELRKTIDETLERTINVEYEPVYHQPRRVWGHTTESWNYYGAAGRLDSTRVGSATAGPVTRYSYDARQRVTAVRDPEGHRTSYEYEQTGFQNTSTVTRTDPAGTSRQTFYGYDAYGRTERITGLTGHVYQYYDLLNRRTSMVDPLGGVTQYAYTGNFLHRVTDAVGKSYVYNRNALGWVESEVDPNGRSRYMRYDRNGNTTATVNRRGQTISFTFDARGRVRTRVADGATTTYEYDPAELWVTATNGESSDRITYDQGGRITEELATRTNVYQAVGSTYSAAGPRERVVYRGPIRGGTYTHRYDAAGSLDQFVDLAGYPTNIVSNHDGQPTQLSVWGGPVQYRSYTPMHQLREVRWNSAALNNALAAQFRYDAAGRLTSRTDLSGMAGRGFEYDANSRLTGYYDYQDTEELVCPNQFDTDCYYQTQRTVSAERSYSYDAVGNRTDSGATLESSSNRYATFGGFTLQYDADGNLTRRYNWSFDQQLQWNSLGQLTGVYTNTTGSVSYGYDGFGRRVRRTGPDGSITRYVYDGENLALELDAAGNNLREYTYHPGTDRPHSVRVGNGAEYYYSTDQVGHVLGLVRRDGTLANAYRYGPWGESESAVEGVAQPLRFMARELDDATGLYYVRARWYDPQIGRFVSEDPTGIAGGTNVYVYAANDPVNLTDPSGLDVCTIVWRVVWEVRYRNGVEVGRKELSRSVISVTCEEEAESGSGGGPRADPDKVRPNNACSGFLADPAVRGVMQLVRERSLQSGVEHGAWLVFGGQSRLTAVWAEPGTATSMTVPPPPAGGRVFVHGHPNFGANPNGRIWGQRISPDDSSWARNHPGTPLVAVGRDTVSMDEASWARLPVCSWK